MLTYWRILPWIVRGFSAVLQRSLGIGGAVGFGTAANIFVGMVEAPLFIRPYLAALSHNIGGPPTTCGIAILGMP